MNEYYLNILKQEICIEQCTKQKQNATKRKTKYIGAIRLRSVKKIRQKMMIEQRVITKKCNILYIIIL